MPAGKAWDTTVTPRVIQEWVKVTVLPNHTRNTGLVTIRRKAGTCSRRPTQANKVWHHLPCAGPSSLHPLQPFARSDLRASEKNHGCLLQNKRQLADSRLCRLCPPAACSTVRCSEHTSCNKTCREDLNSMEVHHAGFIWPEGLTLYNSTAAHHAG